MRIIFIGTGEVGLPTLEALTKSPGHHVLAVVTQPDRPVGRQLKLAAPLGHLPAQPAIKLHI